MPIDSLTLRIWGYNLAVALGAAFGLPFLFPLVLLSEKRRKTVFRRLGVTPVPARQRHTLRPIWVHALSVGEVMAAVPLVQALGSRFPESPVVVSVSTLGGFELATERMQGLSGPVFFFPFDFWPSVQRVVRRVDPALVLLLETDLWPNFIFSLKQRKIPLLLVNARVSERSYARYRRFQPASRMLFCGLSAVCAPTAEDARRFARLGVPERRIQVTGNLKFEAPMPSLMTPLKRKALREALGFSGDQPLMVAGSTHKGEEEMLLKAFLKVQRAFPETGIILAPRHPQRALDVHRTAELLGVRALLMGEQDKKRPERVPCLIVDRLGLLNRLYAVADMVFVGGSLVREGGHNPLEPAAWAKPLLFGPDMSDFASIARRLLEAGAAVQVHDPKSLEKAMVQLMKDTRRAASMGEKASRMVWEGKGALDRVLTVVAEHLPQGSGPPLDRGREREADRTPGVSRGCP